MALTELRLPRLSHPETENWNTLLGAGGERTFRHGDAEWRLQVQAPNDETTPPQQAFCLSGEMDGEPFALLLPASCLNDWLQHLTGCSATNQLPEALALAVVETLFGELSTLASSLLGRRLHLSATSWNAPAPALPFALAWTLTAPEGEPAHGVLLASSAALLTLADLLECAHSADTTATDLLELPSGARYTLAGLSLGIEELHSLSAGDVLLTPPGTNPCQPLLQAGTRLLARLSCPENHFIVEEVFSMTTDAQPISSEASSLDDLPVQISFDLGEAPLSFAQLRALKPGQILETGRDLKAAVRLCANGVAMGEGMMVDIDGRLGIMISRIAPPHRESR